MPMIVSEFPRDVEEIENTWIPLGDGCRLAARIWLPVDAAANPVPAVLEYLPYRKRDGTAARDQEMHPYVAGHGYACLRVDMRGSGDSDGILRDEYLAQEQDDALEVIAWIAAQPWCTGKVGMIGISWGGFNGLQVAARRPAALAAVITLCSTDDRYADDIHYVGGALLWNNLTWGSTMFAHVTRPPDPAISGERWRDMWLQRLSEAVPLTVEWLHHQRRDALWAHGSVCEDFGAISCPVYAVGGWADAYSNAIFRLLAGLASPSKGLIGPWAHQYPQSARPGPSIGFLQECLRWWDHWLKGRDTGIAAEPRLRAWILASQRPDAWPDMHPGEWVAEAAWPSSAVGRQFFLTGSGLSDSPGPPSEALVSSPEDCGLAAGTWCPHGQTPDMPLDQRDDDARSVLFDTPPLPADLAILGAPVLDLELSSDCEVAKLVVRLCEVHGDGASTRVSYGILNLTHRDSHAEPRAMEPGAVTRVRVTLNDVGYRFAAGNRIRLALSSTYWPLTWPSPGRATLRIVTGGACLSLPERQRAPADATLAPFARPEIAPRLARTEVRPGEISRVASHDHATGLRRFEMIDDTGRQRDDRTGLEFATRRVHAVAIHPDDPLSARASTEWETETGRGPWQTRVATRVAMTSTRSDFHLVASLDAFEGDDLVFHRDWDETIPRDLV